MGCGGSKEDGLSPSQVAPSPDGAAALNPEAPYDLLAFPALAAAAQPQRGWEFPKLTAEQMVQCEKKTKLIKGQLAKPSKWDTPFENDYRQTVDLGAAALKQALPDTKLVDAAWLAAVADKGGLLPRCQDLPAEAVVTLEDMEKGDFYGLLAALVISCPWVSCPPPNPPDLCLPHTSAPPPARVIRQLDAGHPDQDGEQLARLAFVLKAFATKAGEKGGRVGVFWDYVS